MGGDSNRRHVYNMRMGPIICQTTPPSSHASPVTASFLPLLVFSSTRTLSLSSSAGLFCFSFFLAYKKNGWGVGLWIENAINLWLKASLPRQEKKKKKEEKLLVKRRNGSMFQSLSLTDDDVVVLHSLPLSLFLLVDPNPTLSQSQKDPFPYTTKQTPDLSLLLHAQFCTFTNYSSSFCLFINYYSSQCSSDF